MEKTRFTIEIYKQKIKIHVSKDDGEPINRTNDWSDLDDLNFKVFKKVDGTIKFSIILREKYDPSVESNRVLDDNDVFQFVSLVPPDYNLYASNYRATIDA